MSYVTAEQELKSLPAEYLSDVVEYIKLLKCKIAIQQQEKSLNKKLPVIGLAEGKYIIPDDINQYDDEIVSVFGEI